MLKLRNTLLIAILLTLAVPYLWSVNAQKPSSSDNDGAATRAWAAVAPGRVEAASKEIKITAPVLGRIAQVLVRPNDNVFAGELLVRLDDADLQARLAIAETEVAIRKRARDEKAMPRKAAARRKAEDAVADTERAVAEASAALDRATTERHSGGGSDESVKTARAGLASLRSKLVQQETDLRRIKAESNTPLPGPTEGDLNVARDELSLAYANLEKTRIRAPIVGTVLKVFANAGELAMPSPDQPLLLLADLSALQVQAELDARDIGQVHIGQSVSVRAPAFPKREFVGRVASVSKLVGPGGHYSRGSRKLTDVDVVDVLVDLIDPEPLIVGMQTDVYFRNEPPKTGQAPPGNAQAEPKLYVPMKRPIALPIFTAPL